MTIKPPFSFVGIAGIPRSGSTLLCQLMAEHPQVYSEGHSSPVCSMLWHLRRAISDDDFLLAQLDAQFDKTYSNLGNAARGFLRGWYENCGEKVVVDKNRAWLRMFEYLLSIEPEARLLVCVRELGQVFGSIEQQHQRTILLDFVDHSADVDPFERSEKLFGTQGAVGHPLASVRAIEYLPAEAQRRILVVKFEELLAKPVEKMQEIYEWIGVDSFSIDKNHLKTRPSESDSHYRFKFPHHQSPAIHGPTYHQIPHRIQTALQDAHSWFYDKFYSALKT